MLYIVPSGPSGTSGSSNGSPSSSNGSPGSSNGTSGSLDAPPPSPNESPSNSNESSAADDSSSLDPLDGGLTPSAEASAAATKPFSDSIKARALHIGRTLSRRADFTCKYHGLLECFHERLANRVFLTRYRGRDLLHGQQWPLLRQREACPFSPVCHVSAPSSKLQPTNADPANGTVEMPTFMSPTAPLVISTRAITPSPTGAKAIFTTGHLQR